MINNHAYHLGTVVKLKKPHPSKTKAWKIVRIGVDIKMVSKTDPNLHIIIPRFKFNKLVKEIVES